MNRNNKNLSQEFDRQVQNLINCGYAKAFSLNGQDLYNKILPLRAKLEGMQMPDIDFNSGTLPFVIVIKSSLMPSEKMMSLVEKNGQSGVTVLRPLIAQDFKTISTVNIPNTEFYLIADIDRGKETINLPPNGAIKIITSGGRSPLTIDEGIAILTHFPEFLVKNNCFSLLASRTGNDQRVPAIWINSKKQPNLGWCWDGNPHTWLGSASCGNRIA